MAGSLPQKTSNQHLPQAPPRQCHTCLADGNSQPGSWPASKSGDGGESPSLTSRQQPPLTASQPRCAAEDSSSKCAGPRCQTQPPLLERSSAPVFSSLHQHVAFQQQPASVPCESSQGRVVTKSSIPGRHSRNSAEKLTTSGARSGQAEADPLQNRQQACGQAGSDAQVMGSAGAPGTTKPRPGLRSRPDTPATRDKAGMAAPPRSEFAHRKQAGAECARSGHGMVYGSSSRGFGRGRAFGRGGRRGRARSALFRTSQSEPQPAGTPLPPLALRICSRLCAPLLCKPCTSVVSQYARCPCLR